VAEKNSTSNRKSLRKPSRKALLQIHDTTLRFESLLRIIQCEDFTQFTGEITVQICAGRLVSASTQPQQTKTVVTNPALGTVLCKDTGRLKSVASCIRCRLRPCVTNTTYVM
jgi:hypothetical protein